MDTPAVNLYSLKATELKLYLLAALFVGGNLLLPQLCHLLPLGGNVLLPILFFTLISAYKFGLLTGLLTGLASPIVNHALFGMPSNEMMVAVLIKSVLLALFASLIANRTKSVSILNLLAVVVSYQVVGSSLIGFISGDFTASLQTILVGLPGMALQVIGGYLFLNAMRKI